MYKYIFEVIYSVVHMKMNNNQYTHANVATKKHDLWALSIFKIPINWFAFGVLQELIFIRPGEK